MDINTLVKEEYSAVTGDAPFNDPVRSHVIMYDPASYSRLASNVEVSRFCEKRLRGINTSRGGYSPRDLMFMCMCTDGYKVSEEYLDSVSNEDVALMWSHIDTLRVSSTLSCRTMVSELVGARSYKGFRRHAGMTVPSTVNPGNHLSIPGRPPVERLHGRSVGEVEVESILRHLDYTSAKVSPPRGYYTAGGMLASEVDLVHNESPTSYSHVTLEDVMAEEVMRRLGLYRNCSD